MISFIMIVNDAVKGKRINDSYKISKVVIRCSLSLLHILKYYPEHLIIVTLIIVANTLI